jgi:dihydrofolate synthase/folylpolyglutamate synthase
MKNEIHVIHVAGTNGKGSVCVKIARSLELAGHKVGLLMSPHISSFRERMSINGSFISENEVANYLPKIFDLCEKNAIPATFFEMTTGLAFKYFADSGVDVVVLETGLGGRLDATNVVEKPALCVITSIGLEHTAVLGNTVELIAAEKAGIIKKHVPIIVGPNVPHEVIRKIAHEKGAEGYYTCDDILAIDEPSTSVGYVDYDIENSHLARAAIKLLQSKSRGEMNFPSKTMVDNDINNGVLQRPICRFEEIRIPDAQKEGVIVILDIAHNPPAMQTLVAKLEAKYPSRSKRIVVGFSDDKDISNIAELLLSTVTDASYIHLVEAFNLRAAKLDKILHDAPKLKDSRFDREDRSISTQVKSALGFAEKGDEVLVVCGSVFLMAEVRKALGIDEPRDSKHITNVAGSGLFKVKARLEKEKIKN